MNRPVHEPDLAKRRANRAAGRNIANPILADLGQRSAGASLEVRIEAYRAVIRAGAQSIAQEADPARAAGILAAALEDVVPAWSGEELKAAMRAKADRALGVLNVGTDR